MALTLDNLVGSWNLADVTRYDDPGSAGEKPWGDPPAGQLVYLSTAHMSVVVAGHGEMPAIAYAGRVRIDGDIVRHEVRVALPPVTGDVKRVARLADGGTTLVLATNAGYPRTELTWRLDHSSRV